MSALLAEGNNFRISSSFGAAVIEGTLNDKVQGSGRTITFYIEQLAPEFRTVYVEIQPSTGHTEDFWDNFWSNKIGGEPADQFALSKYVSVDGVAGVFSMTLNADTFPEGIETFRLVVYSGVLGAEFISADFVVIDDDSGVQPVSHVGTAGNDKLQGGQGADVLDGGAGNDLLIGGAGNDVIIGGIGNDALWAGAGDDTILGGTGNDTVGGGLGNDLIDARAGGQNELWGAAGNDTIRAADTGDNVGGGVGNDLIHGGAGADELTGGFDHDTVYGGAGDDLIYLSKGNDVGDGGDGADTIVAGPGFDRIWGGAGADQFDFWRGAGWNLLEDFSAPEGDTLALSRGLWTGTHGALTAGQVVDTFGSVNASGDAVLDFAAAGTTVVIVGAGTLDGLADSIVAL
ncbi:calcium-binding protein [Gemmobacter nectariphilus]|uniref:calcium-binding protein n=1 Tax=Gemmobacter nectariphilus TaxID=220343 RepID=UPI000A06E457|nr:calcium-binding protein [Gemmobacter nectariphilus]